MNGPPPKTMPGQPRGKTAYIIREPVSLHAVDVFLGDYTAHVSTLPQRALSGELSGDNEAIAACHGRRADETYGRHRDLWKASAEKANTVGAAGPTRKVRVMGLKLGVSEEAHVSQEAAQNESSKSDGGEKQGGGAGVQSGHGGPCHGWLRGVALRRVGWGASGSAGVARRARLRDAGPVRCDSAWLRVCAVSVSVSVRRVRLRRRGYRLALYGGGFSGAAAAAVLYDARREKSGERCLPLPRLCATAPSAYKYVTKSPTVAPSRQALRATRFAALTLTRVAVGNATLLAERYISNQSCLRWPLGL